ncbi:MAG: hypothetical protein QGI47_05620 [Candidatus Marinimicrobia bacterium]|jgi:uncharacterized membrane protein YphA (DoxX/SURF4 family)|nr:hypothetical protein [Candidatus Neomarinimicrobiota bacterium]MDP7273096.1 hypothetical protein [Candidatus Neomarinimicrobiota bacterium]
MSITVISFCHVYFGFLAALKGVRPILICIGIATRFSTMILIFTMLFAGPGKFSFDQQFLK